MDRKLAATFLLSFLVALLAASLVVAADKAYVPMEDRAVMPARWAPVYGFGGAEDNQYAAPGQPGKIELGVKGTNAVGEFVGTTTYDYQHNGTMGRMIEHRGTSYLQMAWMFQDTYVLGSGRKGYHNVVPLSTCNPETGYEVNPNYGGYVTFDVWPTLAYGIVGVHCGPDMDNMRPRAYWDYYSGGAEPEGLWDYNDYPPDPPDDVYGGYQEPNWEPNGLGANEHQNMWPVIEMQTGGPEFYLHMVVAESGGAAGDPQTISYYRRSGPYGDHDGGGTWSRQRPIDTVEDISPIVVASERSGKVAIAWTAPADFRRDQDAEFNGFAIQYCNDIWFTLSTNYGQNWIDGIGDPITDGPSIQEDIDMGIHLDVAPAYGVTWDDDGGNITNYSWQSDFKAYTNVSALFSDDENEYLHIVWNGRRWTDTTSLYRRQSGMWHWSTDPASGGGTAGVIRTVAKALWDSGGTCYGHAWGSDLDKMSISQCGDNFYVLWVQFGNIENPCYDYEKEDKFVNGELYLSASNDAGFHWDRGDNLTETVTHECESGDCDSDHWPTMARYGRDAVTCDGFPPNSKVLDIMYINDKCAGGAVQDGKGIWTTNDVMWYATLCRDVVPEPGYNDDLSSGLGEVFSSTPLVIDPGGDTTISFTIENTGLLENNITISLRPSLAADWLEVDPSIFPVGTGTINYQVVNLNFTAPTGSPDPAVYVCTMDIEHQATPKTTREVPISLMVCSEFTRPQSAILATPLKRVKVWNTGEISRDADNASLDFIDDCDTLNPNVNSEIYLYCASPVVCRIDGSDTLRFTAYSANYVDDDGLRPMGWATGTRDSVVVDSTTHIDYSYTEVKYATVDTTIGFISQYFVPKDPQYADWIVCRNSWFNLTGDTIHDVLIGEFLDWDIATDYRTDTVITGETYTTGNAAGYEIIDSVWMDDEWAYSGILWQQGVEANDSLEGDCPTAENNSTRYGGIVGDPLTPFVNASVIDNPTWVYPAGKTLWPGKVYEAMKNRVGFSEDYIWEANPEAPESTETDVSMLITFGEYDLPPGSPVGWTNAHKYSYTFALITTPGGQADSAQAYADFVQLCKDALTWIAADTTEMIITHCLNVPGDANNDGACNLGDATYVNNYVFKPAQCATNPPIGCPPQCPAEGDANGDGKVNLGDATYINNFVFRPAQCATNPPIGCPPVPGPEKK
jgi:hypothetical protein